VLQISANSSKNEIKAAFRKLAKLHHPDLRSHQHQDGEGRNDTAMTELITAYETLMNKHNEDFFTDARDSRVALACEMYTIDELRNMHHVFDVHSFRVSFNSDSDDGQIQMHTASPCNNQDKTILEQSRAATDKANGNRHNQLDPTPIIPLTAHPDDSISDLKRQIQSTYADAWGLNGRMVDRDGLYLGWELVHCGDEPNDIVPRDSDLSVLSYHLFLHSYCIKDGDVLHAVVRRMQET